MYYPIEIVKVGMTVEAVAEAMIMMPPIKTTKTSVLATTEDRVDRMQWVTWAHAKNEERTCGRSVLGFKRNSLSTRRDEHEQRRAAATMPSRLLLFHRRRRRWWAWFLHLERRRWRARSEERFKRERLGLSWRRGALFLLLFFFCIRIWRDSEFLFVWTHTFIIILNHFSCISFLPFLSPLSLRPLKKFWFPKLLPRPRRGFQAEGIWEERERRNPHLSTRSKTIYKSILI